MLEIVSNSGPFIHLKDIARTELLNNFSKIFIPEKVFKEVKDTLPKLINLEIVKISSKEADSFSEQLKGFRLQEAEIDALYLAKKLNKTFFTDDLKAREAAERVGIDAHGSIGIISLFYKRGVINRNEAKKAIDDLYEKSSLFVSKAIVDIAIKELFK